MPFFRVELERHVSRVVELRQTTTVMVEASDIYAATFAVLDIARDENRLCRHIEEWSDDNASRQASDDEQVRQPSVRIVSPAPDVLAWPNTINAIPPAEVPDAE